ncbi:ribosomal-processing cysteine protease Prp [Oceanotoga sp. DSM 15011]|jgi:hypothetical protein|uniref:Ribosomal processing cysteine protease Prp n=1 Tax=Oceanotoga teriensis TaxID=515440 RepID=A0AA45C657_9BACT|nr:MULTISPECIES: ribosomal-processing cysteine protease Prp [Oceanotoga]MDN5341749.1 uncharacterized protein [Oceanotoga sp.]MDO7975661.1 ribosomal-processing cysteine protease Prp [Oceanotoga teriensis]PWJ90590.1 hypothetical protein C7380_11260 [Oceanotoga teriensis]UYO99835.1 ribosomal-processing cysteine protease Prp [Oceanotoga sp. DSM 15011]
MIKVLFEKNYILIKGHASNDLYKKDIVCSAVSTLTQFVANVLSKEKLASFKISEGYLKIDLLEKNDFSNKLVKYLIETIKGIEKNYPDYVKVEVK